MSDLTELSATEMARCVRAKQVSPVELAQAHLERIAELQPRLNAFVEIDGERALAAAHVAEARVMRGENDVPLVEQRFGTMRPRMNRSENVANAT